VPYSDLRTDLEGEVRRIARFLEIEVPDDAWPAIVRNCSFAEMKAKGRVFAPNGGHTLQGWSTVILSQRDQRQMA